MSQTIDEKVVEMRFENSNFESNVSQSLSTLDKLKKSLDLSDSAKTFEEVSKAAGRISFDGLASGIETVKVHFTALEGIALGALERIGQKAADLGIKMAKSISTDLVGAGFDQYEAKTRAVQTIMAATGETIDSVDARMEKLIWYADETSASFSDMVDNVGKFTSAGVDIDKATDAMMGIFNWASVSGAGVTEARRAMYNLSQAMGVGAVTAIDWKSIENANMSTKEFKQQVIDTAVAMGKLTSEAKTLGKGTQVTAENMRTTLDEKWFDDEVLVSVLGKYNEYANLVYERVLETGESCSDAMAWVSENMGEQYDFIGEKAFKAGQEAKTFTDAVEAAREAVKSQWGTLFESIFGNYEDAKVLWTNLANSLWDVFAQPLESINEVVKEALGGDTIDRKEWVGALKDISGRLGITGDDFGVFERAVMDTARANGVAIDDLIEKYGDFRASLEAGWLTSDILQETMQNIEDGTLETGNALEDVADVVQRVWAGEFGNIDSGRFEKLKEAGWDPEFIQSLVDKGADYVVTLDDISDATLKNMGYTEEEIELLRKIAEEAGDTDSALAELASKTSGKAVLQEAWDNLVNDETGVITRYVNAFRDAFSDVFGNLESGDVRGIIDRFHDFTESLLDESRIHKFQNFIHGIASVLHVVYGTIKGIFGIAKAIFDGTLGPIIKGIAKIVGELVNGILGLFGKLDGAEGYFDAFGKAAEWIGEKLAPVAKVIETVATGISIFIHTLFMGIPVGKALENSFEWIVTHLADVFGEEAANKARNFFNKTKKLASQFGDTFKKVGGKIKDAFDIFRNTELGQSLSTAFANLRTRVSTLWTNFTDWVKGIFKFGEDEEGEGFDFFGTLETGLESFTTWLEGIDLETKINNISDAIQNLGDRIKGIFGENGTGLSGVFSLFSDGFKGLFSLFGSISKIFGKLGYNVIKLIFGEESADKVKEKVTAIIDTFKHIKDKVKEAFDVFRGTDLGQSVAQAFEKLKTKVSTLWENFKSWVKETLKFGDGNKSAVSGLLGTIAGEEETVDLSGGILGRFNNWLDTIDIEGKVTAISDAIMDLKDKIKGLFSGGEEGERGGITGWISSKWDTAKEKLSGVKEQLDFPDMKQGFSLETILDNVKNALQWIVDHAPSWDTVLKTFSTALGGGVLWSIITLIMKIKKMFSGGSGFVTNLNKILSGVGGFFKSMAMKNYSAAALDFAKAFGIILGVIAAIALFVDVDKFSQVALDVALLAFVFGLVAKAMAELFTSLHKGEKDTSKADKIKEVTSTWKDSLGTAAKNISEGVKKWLSMTAVATVIFSIAVAIGVLTAAILLLARLKWEDIGKGMAVITVLLMELGAFIKLTSSDVGLSFGKGGLSYNGKKSGGLIGLAFALLAFCGVIALIAKFDIPTLAKSLGALFVILLELGMFQKMAGGKGTVGSGASIMLLAVGILILTSAVKKLSKLDFVSLLKGVGALGAIMLFLGLFVKNMKAYKPSVALGFGASMIMVAIAVKMVASALMNLAELSFGSLMIGIGGLAAVILTLAGGIWVLGLAAKNINGVGLGVTLLGIAAVIGAIAAAVWVLTTALKDLDLDTIKEKLPELLSSLVEILLNTLIGAADSIFAGIVSTLDVLLTYAPQIIDKLISLFILVIDGLTARMGELADSISGFCKALIGEFGRAFEGVDTTPLIIAIGALMAGVAEIVLIGRFGSIGAVLKGLAILGIIALAFGAVISVLSGINELVKGLCGEEGAMLEFLENGVTLLTTIGEAIGSFFGGILGGLVETTFKDVAIASAYLPYIGNNLTEFMNNVQGFADGAANLPPGMASGIGELATAMLALTGSEFADSLATWFEAIIGIPPTDNKYADNFESVAEAIVLFQNRLSEGDIDISKLEMARSAASIITSIVGLSWPGSGSFSDNFMNFFFGLENATEQRGYMTSWEERTENTVAYAKAIIDFVNKINESGLTEADEGAMTRAEAIANTISSITSKNWPEASFSDKLLNFLYGLQNSERQGYVTSWDMRTENTVAYAEAIIGFVNKINEAEFTEADEGALERAGTLAKTITDITSLDWPEVGVADGLLSFIKVASGNDEIPNTWDLMVEHTLAYARAIAGFIDAINKSDLKTQDQVELTKAQRLAETITSITSLNWPKVGLADDILAFIRVASGNGEIPNTWDLMVEQTLAYARAITGFVDAINESDLKAQDQVELNKATRLAETITDITSLNWPKVGLADDILAFIRVASGNGEVPQTWDLMVDQTIAYARAIVGFVEEINAADLRITDQLELNKAKKLAQTITDITSLNWPKTGLSDNIIDFVSKCIGAELPNTWDNDYSKIVSYAKGIVDFVTELNREEFEYDPEKMGNAQKAASILSQISGYDWPALSIDDNFVSFFNTIVGDDVLKTTWEQMRDNASLIGAAIVNFSTALGTEEISEDTMRGAGIAARVISYILSLNWPSEGGIGNFFSSLLGGETVSWETLQTQMPAVGGALVAFADSVKGIKEEEVNQAVRIFEIIEGIVGMANNMTELGDGSTKLSELSTKLTVIFGNIKEMLTTLKNDFSDEKSAGVLSSVSTLMENLFGALDSGSVEGGSSYVDAGASVLSSFAEGFEGGTSVVIEQANTFSTNLVAILSAINAYRLAAYMDMVGFIAGLRAGGALAYILVTGIVTRIISKFNTSYNDFYESGKYLMDGLIDGINSKVDELIRNIQEIGDLTETAFNQRTGIESPSKVFMRSGRFLMLGLAKGISDNAYLGSDAAEYSAQETMDAVTAVLSRINFDNLDDAPVIRPVLDLSDIQNGVGLIGGMLDTERSIGLSTYTSGRLAGAIGQTGYDGVNPIYNDVNVIRTINALGSKVDGLNQSIKSMQVVINGKKLVGAIAGDMESELSGRVIKQKRGVM